MFEISLSRRNAFSYEVGVQMVEIYNEQVRDLLSNNIAQKRYPFRTKNMFTFHMFWNLMVTFLVFILLDIHRKICYSWHKETLGIWNTSQPNGLVVPDASLHPVKSTSDVLDLMGIGQTNRAVGSTALNERSSRSHRYIIDLLNSNP